MFFAIFFHKSFYIYMKISRDSSARYYQRDKEKIQKSLVKEIKVLQKKKKSKNKKMVVSNIGISQKLKNKDYLSIEKDITK